MTIVKYRQHKGEWHRYELSSLPLSTDETSVSLTVTRIPPSLLVRVGMWLDRVFW